MSKNLFNPRRASEATTTADVITVLNELISAKETGIEWSDTFVGLTECRWLAAQSEYRQEVLGDLFECVAEIHSSGRDAETKAKLIEARYLIRFS